MATHTIDRIVDANGNEFVFSDSSRAEAGTNTLKFYRGLSDGYIQES